MEFMKRNKKRNRFANDDDPLSGVANLFDVAMIFAVGLLVVSLMYLNLTELMTESDVTIVKNPGQIDMQMIIKEGKEIKTLNTTEMIVGGEGSMIGGIYQLGDGTMIYMPEEMKPEP